MGPFSGDSKGPDFEAAIISFLGGVLLILALPHILIATLGALLLLEVFSLRWSFLNKVGGFLVILLFTGGIGFLGGELLIWIFQINKIQFFSHKSVRIYMGLTPLSAILLQGVIKALNKSNRLDRSIQLPPLFKMKCRQVLKLLFGMEMVEESNSESFTFGAFKETGLPAKLNWRDINYHMHIVGQSGFGKTTFLRNLINWHIHSNRGFMFMDLKADIELEREILSSCKKANRLQELLVLNLSKPEGSISYNPIARGNATEIKDKIMASLVWSEEYYKKVAERFLLVLCQGLVAVRNQKGLLPNLRDLYHCLCDSNYIRSLSLEVPNSPENEDLHKELHLLIAEMSRPQGLEVISGIRTDIGVMINSEFGEILTRKQASLDLNEAIQTGKIVYVMLDSQTLPESAQRLGKLLLSDLRAASGTIATHQAKQDRAAFTVIVDEFADLATEQFTGFMNRARGSNLGVVIAHQEFSDLNRCSEIVQGQVLGSSLITLCFRQKKPESAELVSSFVGTKTIQKKTYQMESQFGFDFKTGTGSGRDVEEFIIHPQVIKNLKPGECVFVPKNPSESGVVEVQWMEPVIEEIESVDLEKINKISKENAEVELNFLNLNLQNSLNGNGNNNKNGNLNSNTNNNNNTFRTNSISNIGIRARTITNTDTGTTVKNSAEPSERNNSYETSSINEI